MVTAHDQHFFHGNCKNTTVLSNIAITAVTTEQNLLPAFPVPSQMLSKLSI